VSYEIGDSGNPKWVKATTAFFKDTFKGSVKLTAFDETIFATFESHDDRDKFIDKFGGVRHPDATTVAKIKSASQRKPTEGRT
jgi:hypothetical protein